MRTILPVALSLTLAMLPLACSKKTPPAESEASGQQVVPPSETKTEPAPSDVQSETEADEQPATSDRAKPTDATKPEATSKPSSKKRYVVAALGDSITDYRSGGGGFLRLLEEACPKSEFDNFGKGGDMTNQMRRRFEREILPRVRERGYTTVIVYGGVNDLYSNLTAGRSNDRIQGDLSRIYAQAKDAGMKVVAITVSPWGGFTRYFNAERSRNTRMLNSWILGGPAAGRVDSAVDSYPALSCGDPEKLCVDYQRPRPDGLHPGTKGHQLLGELLLEEVFADCE